MPLPCCSTTSTFWPAQVVPAQVLREVETLQTDSSSSRELSQVAALHWPTGGGGAPTGGGGASAISQVDEDHELRLHQSVFTMALQLCSSLGCSVHDLLVPKQVSHKDSHTITIT